MTCQAMDPPTDGRAVWQCFVNFADMSPAFRSALAVLAGVLRAGGLLEEGVTRLGVEPRTPGLKGRYSAS